MVKKSNRIKSQQTKSWNGKKSTVKSKDGKKPIVKRSNMIKSRQTKSRNGKKLTVKKSRWKKANGEKVRGVYTKYNPFLRYVVVSCILPKRQKANGKKVEMEKSQRWKSERRLYKVQPVPAICGSILYSAAFEFGCTICCTDSVVLAQWKKRLPGKHKVGGSSPPRFRFYSSHSRCRFTFSLWFR